MVLTAPDVFEDAESIVNDPRLAQEELEEVELLRGQFDSGGPASHLPRSGIELHIGESQKLARLARRAAHQRSNPREELLDRERFDEVIVGARVEAGDTVRDRVARRQHQYRGRIPALAKPSRDAE